MELGVDGSEVLLQQTVKEIPAFKKQRRCVQTRKKTQSSWRVGRPRAAGEWEDPGSSERSQKCFPWGGHDILIVPRSLGAED